MCQVPITSPLDAATTGLVLVSVTDEFPNQGFQVQCGTNTLSISAKLSPCDNTLSVNQCHFGACSVAV